MAKRCRYIPGQVVRRLCKSERLLGTGQDFAAVCKHLEVSEQTWYCWRSRYGGMKADDARRLKGVGEGEPAFAEDRCRSGLGHRHA